MDKLHLKQDVHDSQQQGDWTTDAHRNLILIMDAAW